MPIKVIQKEKPPQSFDAIALKDVRPGEFFVSKDNLCDPKNIPLESVRFMLRPDFSNTQRYVFLRNTGFPPGQIFNVNQGISLGDEAQVCVVNIKVDSISAEN